jgi:hypothetical protein
MAADLDGDRTRVLSLPYRSATHLRSTAILFRRTGARFRPLFLSDREADQLNDGSCAKLPHDRRAMFLHLLGADAEACRYPYIAAPFRQKLDDRKLNMSRDGTLAPRYAFLEALRPDRSRRVSPPRTWVDARRTQHERDAPGKFFRSRAEG